MMTGGIGRHAYLYLKLWVGPKRNLMQCQSHLIESSHVVLFQVYNLDFGKNWKSNFAGFVYLEFLGQDHTTWVRVDFFSKERSCKAEGGKQFCSRMPRANLSLLIEMEKLAAILGQCKCWSRLRVQQQHIEGSWLTYGMVQRQEYS